MNMLGFVVAFIVAAVAIGVLWFVSNKSTKMQAVVGALFTAAFGFIGWLVALPPEQQTGILGQFVGLFPASIQPAVGFWSKAFSSLSAIYMVYKAAHSGPQTPPTNPPK